ncbi:MAG: heparinase II/III family protein [Luteolibacter sp.]
MMTALLKPTCPVPKSPAPTLNLMTGRWTVEDIAVVLARHPRKPLLPPMDSEPWQRAAENPLVLKLAASGCRMAVDECSEPLPQLTDELYAHFRQTGLRVNFEQVYFERRRRLARAALALLLAGKNDAGRDRLAASLVEKLEAIFDEVSWAVPAHVNWDNDDVSGKEPMQIDLFCAETANLMAEMLDVFGAVIPPALREQVRERLGHSIFKNFLKRDFHWMDVSHNWNAVCHQGVVGAALSQIDNPHELAVILHRMASKLPLFLAGYGADGGCSEGPGYWAYGFGWFARLNEQLEARTGGELSLFAGDEHVRAIARYGPRMMLAGGHLVNFSDSPHSGGLDPALLTYLGERLDESDCRSAGEESWRRLVSEGVKWNAQRTDVSNLLRQMLCVPVELPPMARRTDDCFLPDLAVIVARGVDAAGHLWEFAAKGGNNDEHHNHNDCGSFILNIDGQRLLREIGSPAYIHDYFGAKRYEFLAARSLGHSVPCVNGFEQGTGSSFFARVLSASSGDDRVEFSVDLTGCYPSAAHCLRLVRTWVFEKIAGRLTVSDDYELDGPGVVESVFIGDGALQSSTPPVAIRIQPAEGTRLIQSETVPFQNHQSEADQITRLRFAVEAGLASAGRIEISIAFADKS